MVVESVDSVDGDAAPLRALHAVCRARGALLVVDEAHGLGVRGPGGRGLLAEVGLAGADDVVATVTLSKALGAQGGAVLGPAGGDGAPRRHRPLVHLRHRPRAVVASARRSPRCTCWRPNPAGRPRCCAMPPPSRRRPERRLPGRRSCRWCWASRRWRWRRPAPACARGVRVGCFRPPSVPAGTSRLRLTARADLTEADLARSARSWRRSSRRWEPDDRHECRRRAFRTAAGRPWRPGPGPRGHRHRDRRRQDRRHRRDRRPAPEPGRRAQAGADRGRGGRAGRPRRRRPARGPRPPSASSPATPTRSPPPRPRAAQAARRSTPRPPRRPPACSRRPRPRAGRRRGRPARPVRRRRRHPRRRRRRARRAGARRRGGRARHPQRHRADGRGAARTAA